MLYALRFFTTWLLILVIFHKYVHPYVNLLLLAFVTATIGLYFSFINPRRFVFYMQGERYEYTGLEKFIIVDMFFHLLVLYFVWSMYGPYYMSQDTWTYHGTWAAFGLLALYALITNIKRIYGVSFIETISVFIIALIAYTLLFTSN